MRRLLFVLVWFLSGSLACATITGPAQLASTTSGKGADLVGVPGSTAADLGDMLTWEFPEKYMSAATLAAWKSAPSTTDVTSAVQSAVDAGGTVVLSGSYLVSKIVITNPVTLLGWATSGKNSTMTSGLVHDGSLAEPLIEIRGTWSPFAPKGGIRLDNLTLKGGTNTAWLIDAIQANDGPAVTLDNCFLYQAANIDGGGIRAYSSYNWTVTNCRIYGAQTDGSGATGIGIHIHSHSGNSFATTDVNTGTDTLTLGANNFTNGEQVEFTTTGTLPAGLSTGTNYYIIGRTTTTVQVAATLGGTAVNITDVGSGTHTVTVAGGAGVASNMMVFSQVDVYHWGVNLLIGDVGKGGGNTIGPLLFQGGQFSHSEADLVIVGMNARNVSFTGTNFEHWGGGGGNGVVVNNLAWGTTFRDCTFNGAGSSTSEWALTIGYTSTGNTDYTQAWDTKVDGAIFYSCTNGVKVNTNATTGADVDFVSLDRLTFYPATNATGTGIEVASGYTLDTHVFLGTDLVWNAGGNEFASRITDPNSLISRPHPSNGLANPVVLTKTFTDANVNTTTDRITITGHGFSTGDWCSVSNSGGAVPAGLTAWTTYYVYAIDADTLGLASSWANAIAGTLVDITAATGGGTHTITQYPDVEGKSTLVLDPASAATVSGFANGRTGQVLTIMTGTSFANLTIHDGGAVDVTGAGDWSPSSAQDMIQLVNWGGTAWYELTRR